MKIFAPVRNWTCGLAIAAALAFGSAVVGSQEARAVPIVGGIIINGAVNNPTDLDGVDFVNDSGDVAAAVLDFAGLETETVFLTDIDFSTLPGAVWSVGTFTFTIVSLLAPATANGEGGIDFFALGVLSSTNPAFDDTPGTFNFTSNSQVTEIGPISIVIAGFSTTTVSSPVPLPASILLFAAALAGLGLASRRGARGVSA